MNSVNIEKYRSAGLLVLSILFASACGSDDDSKPKTKTIDKISVYLDFNFEVTGDVTLTLKETSSGDVIGDATVGIDGFDDDDDGWIDFIFSSPVNVKTGQTYQIEMDRSNTNIAYSDVVLWRSASSDVYTHGASSSTDAGDLEGDFTFKTYIDGVVDQQQELATEVNIMDNNRTLIQEFIPEAD